MSGRTVTCATCGQTFGAAEWERHSAAGKCREPVSADSVLAALDSAEDGLAQAARAMRAVRSDIEAGRCAWPLAVAARPEPVRPWNPEDLTDPDPPRPVGEQRFPGIPQTRVRGEEAPPC